MAVSMQARAYMHGIRQIWFFCLYALLLCPLPAYSSSPPSGTIIVNRAVATFADANGNFLPEIGATVQTAVSSGPFFIISQTASSDPVRSGTQLTFTITVTNTGNHTATNAVLTDVLPSFTAFAVAEGNGQHENGHVTWILGDIEPGETRSVSVTTDVSVDAVEGSSLPSVAHVICDEGAEATATVSPVIGSFGALSIILSADKGQVESGGLITYILTLTNKGSSPVGNTRIVNALPELTSLFSAGDDFVFSDDIITWNTGLLDPGDSVTRSYTVKTNEFVQNGVVISNTAIASGNDVEEAQSNNVDVVVINNKTITLVALPPTIVANGRDTSLLTARAVDISGNPVPDGSLITFTTDKGLFSNGEKTITIPVSGGNGESVAWLTAPVLALPTIAYLQASIGPVASNTINLQVLPGAASVQVFSMSDNRVVTAADEKYSVRVEITYVDPEGNSRTEVQTVDHNGIYIIPDIQAGGGNYTIVTTVTDIFTGETIIRTSPQLIEIKAGELTTPTTNSIQGHVSDRKKTETTYYPGATVGLYYPDGTIFKSTVTDSKGEYEFSDVPPGDYSIRAVLPDGRVSVLGTPYLNNKPGIVIVDADLLVDPFGIVYDSVTGSPLSGVTVWILNPDGTPAVLPDPMVVQGAVDTNPFVTGADGTYQWPLIAQGSYMLSVVPSPDSGYTFPSVNPSPFWPVDPGSKGDVFIVGLTAVGINIPLDPPPGQLVIRKDSSKNRASIGDMVLYTLSMENTGNSRVDNLRAVDMLPRGIRYVKGSTRINNERSNDPDDMDSARISWPLGTLDAGETISMTYTAVITPGARPGKAKNIATANGINIGKNIFSVPASKTIIIEEGVFTDKSTIIGKVFIDNDGDTVQNGENNEKDHEVGIPDVAIFMEDGTRVVTDRNGKYSISGVTPGTHVLRLDEKTLPEGAKVESLNNRFMGDRASQFIDVTGGLIFKANFAVSGCSMKSFSKSAPDTPVKNHENQGRRSTPENRAQGAILEEEIKTMSSELAFLFPFDGETVQSDKTAVQIKAPMDCKVELKVNGVYVGEDRIGRRVTYPKENIAIYEYINVKLISDNENELQAFMFDPFGNQRGLKSINVKTAGKPDSLVIKIDAQNTPADGVSVFPVTVSAVDKSGNVLQYPKKITVETTAGEILEGDFDAGLQGHQIPCSDGVATFSLKAPVSAGEAFIIAYYDGIEQKEKIFFSPHSREMLITGIGDVSIGKNNNSRWAVFVNGGIGKGVLLTGRYDSGIHEEEDDPLFRANDTDLESEDKYPVYGDESKKEYLAQSRDKMYLKLEKDRSSILYGDYRTDLTQTGLAAYTRSFNGFKADVGTEKISLKSFVADTSQSQVMDTLPARGISGFYRLSRSPVIEGSERVVIETRDRYRPERVLGRVVMSRWSDYHIDYDDGSLLFKSPVSSHDADWNPVYIIVSYESIGDSRDYYIYGGRAAFSPFDWIEMGLTGIVEEKDITDYHLFGSDITLVLPGDITLKAETVRTSSMFDTSDTMIQKDGTGWSLTGEGKPMKNMEFSFYYRDVGEFFYNPSAIDFNSGMEKYGFDVSYLVSDSLEIKSRYFRENDLLNHSDYNHASLGAEKQYKNSSLGLEFSHEKSSDSFIPSSSPTTRLPFENSEETPEDLKALRLSCKTKLLDDLDVILSHKQDVVHNRYSLSQAGFDYQVNELSKMYVRQDYGKFSDRKEMRTSIGGETNVTKNTVTFNEYRLEDGADGKRNYQIIGLRNKFMLGKHLSGNFTFENQETVSGNERNNEPDAFATTLGFEYLMSEKTRFTGCTEYRTQTSGGDDYSYLFETGATHKLNTDYSLLFKQSYFIDDYDSEGRIITAKTMLGLAYRPVLHDRFNFLSKLMMKNDISNTDSSFRDHSYIGSFEGIYQLFENTMLMGKYAGKLMRENDLEVYTDLVSGRIVYDITDRIDFGTEARLFTSHETGTSLLGGYVEMGVRAYKNLWISGGYCFDDFDDDLTGDYNDNGWYIRLRFKFDEKNMGIGKK